VSATILERFEQLFTYQYITTQYTKTIGKNGKHYTLVNLILKKISKIGSTKCQILRLKCTKIDFRWGSAPDPGGGAYSAPLSVFKGPTSKGKEGRGKRGGKRKGK